MAINNSSPYGSLGMSGNADLESARALRSIVGQVGGAGWSPAPGYPTGSGRITPTTWGSGTAANPAVATPYSPTAPVSRPAMGYTPGGTMGIPTPGVKPTPPVGVPAQVPTMGGTPAPSLAPSAGAGLGMPSGVTASPAGQAGLFGGTPGARKSPTTYGGYDSINGGLLTGLGVAGAAVPGLGLLGTAGNIYNTAEYDNALSKLGMPGLTFGQWLGGILGLNRYGYGGQGPSTKDKVQKDANAYANGVAAGNPVVHGSANAGMGQSKPSGQDKPDKGMGYSGGSVMGGSVGSKTGLK